MYYLKKISLPYLKETVLKTIPLFDKLNPLEISKEEKKYELMIEMCQKFFDLLNKKLELLPKVFYGVMYTLKNHFKSTWKDAIICIYFLRVMYPAFLTYETYFIEADKDSKQGFLILITFLNIFYYFYYF